MPNPGYKTGPVAFSNESGVSLLDRVGSVLSKSDDGGATFTALGSSGAFTTDTILQLLNTTPAAYNALEFIANNVVQTPGAEEAAWDIKAAKAGVLTQLMGMGWDLNTFAMLFFGARTNRTGLRLQGAALELCLSGTAYVQLTGTTVNTGSATLTMTNRISRRRGTSQASATTLTLPVDGNLIPVTGVTNVQGIVTAGWQAGHDVVLELPSGLTIVHNSGAPGGGAVAIQLNAAANLVTARVTLLHLHYNGTFWIQEG